MKKYQSLFIILGIIVILLGLVLYRMKLSPTLSTKPSTDVSFLLSAKTVPVGQEFTADVMADPHGNGLTIAAVHLQYDPQFIEFVKVEKAPLFPHVLSQEEFGGGKGTISVGSNSPREPVKEKSSLVRVVFRALKPVQQTTLSFENNTFIGSTVEGAGTNNMIVKMDPVIVSIQ